METFGFVVFSVIIFVSIGVGISTGNKMYAAMLCLFLGPLGLTIVLSIEYAKTAFQPEQETP